MVKIDRYLFFVCPVDAFNILLIEKILFRYFLNVYIDDTCFMYTGTFLPNGWTYKRLYVHYETIENFPKYVKNLCT